MPMAHQSHKEDTNMIIEEFFTINGTEHVRHYSDQKLMIASDDGIEYEVAEDLVALGKVYHETETKIEEVEEDGNN